MRTRLFFLFLILIIPLVVAEGFSPSNLVFSLEQDEEQCQNVQIDSDSESITISDRWAENETVDWRVSAFNTEAGDHGITINYPESFSGGEAEVCISGSKLGEYHGAVVFREEAEGSSVVQYAVWLKVTIQEETLNTNEENQNQNQNNNNNNPGGGSSSNSNSNSNSNSGTVGFVIEETPVENNEDNQNFEPLASPNTEETTTQQTTETPNNSQSQTTNSPFRFIPLILAAGLIVVYIFVTKRNKKVSY